MAVLSLGLVLLSVLSAIQATPVLEARQSISALTTTQVSSFKPYTYYASTAYCNPANTIAWNCGANCNANPKYAPEASGGDGTDNQYWFVGFDSSLNSVIVAHQGTDPSSFLADLTDADIFMGNLDSSLFPGISSSVEVHDGFRNAHARAAPSILSAVQSAMSKHKATHVSIVGHSLGAALALLDAVFLPLHLPAGTVFKTVGFGMPRVGNQAFADYVDSHVTNFNHINNKKDPVPIVPGRFLGFHHPSSEIHISDSGAWMSCPGQDNTSSQCEVGAVPNIFDGSVSNHGGPYDGVTMGC